MRIAGLVFLEEREKGGYYVGRGRWCPQTIRKGRWKVGFLEPSWKGYWSGTWWGPRPRNTVCEHPGTQRERAVMTNNMNPSIRILVDYLWRDEDFVLFEGLPSLTYRKTSDDTRFLFIPKNGYHLRFLVDYMFTYPSTQISLTEVGKQINKRTVLSLKVS